jgi:hypothetical protein
MSTLLFSPRVTLGSYAEEEKHERNRGVNHAEKSSLSPPIIAAARGTQHASISVVSKLSEMAARKENSSE